MAVNLYCYENEIHATNDLFARLMCKIKRNKRGSEMNYNDFACVKPTNTPLNFHYSTNVIFRYANNVRRLACEKKIKLNQWTLRGS